MYDTDIPGFYNIWWGCPSYYNAWSMAGTDL